MIDKHALIEKNPNVCESLFGLKIGPLKKLLEKVQLLREKKLEQNPLSKRGLNADFTFSNQFLLTMEYLRTYQTFEVLAFSYGISKSYANKCYHRTLTLLAQEAGLKNPEKITRKQAAKVIVDVSAQPIERPVRDQETYYNGYKKTHRKIATDCKPEGYGNISLPFRTARFAGRLECF